MAKKSARLSEEQKENILKLFKDNMKAIKIAEQLKINYAQVRYFLRNSEKGGRSGTSAGRSAYNQFLKLKLQLEKKRNEVKAIEEAMKAKLEEAKKELVDLGNIIA